MSCESFWTSDTTSKNDVLTSILTFFCQKSGREDILPTPPLPLSFTVDTDHLMAGEVAPGRGPQWRAAPGNIPINFRRGPHRVRGVAGSQSGPLSLSFLLYSIAGVAPFWADFQNRSALWHTTQIPGEVSLHLVKARSKQNRPRYLTSFPDPGWFRVNALYKVNQ
jgi:hypothetical protein